MPVAMVSPLESNSPPSPNFKIHEWFKPRWYQAKFMNYLLQGGKRAFWVVHRRGGKDLTALHTAARMMITGRKGAYWHIYPTFSQARKAIWEGFTADGHRIIDLVFPKEIVKSRNETE